VERAHFPLTFFSNLEPLFEMDVDFLPLGVERRAFPRKESFPLPPLSSDPLISYDVGQVFRERPPPDVSRVRLCFPFPSDNYPQTPPPPTTKKKMTVPILPPWPPPRDFLPTRRWSGWGRRPVTPSPFPLKVESRVPPRSPPSLGKGEIHVPPLFFLPRPPT